MSAMIKVEGLSKQYRIGALEAAYGTLRESIVGAVRAPLRGLSKKSGKTPHETIWALKDVSLEVQPGEVLGIIGRNGAGKSTLLKILSRITEPTAGRVELYGRLGSLLEVGTGFHPELSGRENIYLNGSILGISRKEIARKFDEIVAFSEVEKFIDTPVKRYSSGMYVRLAFAVAAHLESEVLVIDEVLAVGDASFQTKCLGKMSDVAREGRTVLFVSHNTQAVTTLCKQAAWIDHGRVVKMGRTDEVISAYLQGVGRASAKPLEQVWDNPGTAPGNENVRLHAVRVAAKKDGVLSGLDMQTPFDLEVEYWNLVPDARLIVNCALYALDGSPVFETLTFNESSWHGRPFQVGLYRSVCHIPGNLINQGTYRLRVAFLNEFAEVLYDNREATVFSVHDVKERDFPWFGRFIGNVYPKFEWTTELLTGSD